MNGARSIAVSHRSLTGLVAVWMLLAAVLFGQQPPPPEPWVLVDDIWLPQSVVAGDATFQATPWPGGVVPYSFNPNVTAANQAVAIDAMAEIAAASNITFVARSTQPNYIDFTNSTGNNSYVGMIGGGQVINIYNWNYRFIVCHEILHSLGFWHEHQRPDRDTYVTIQSANFASTYANNFTIMSTASTHGTVYDFDSVMHYSGTAFTNNGQPTIQTKPGYTQYQSQMGQRQHLSLGDCAGCVFQYGPPPAPAVSSLSPSSAPMGGGQLTLTVSGTRFNRGQNDTSPNGNPGSRVKWNGTTLSTTYVNPTTLTAVVPASLLTSGGFATVTVDNPAPGAGQSSGRTFGVAYPAPTLTVASPTTFSNLTPPSTITVAGSGFVPASVVTWDGAPLATTWISSTSLTAVAPTGPITAGTHQVTVETPAPGGGSTSAFVVTVTTPAPTIASVAPSAFSVMSPPGTLSISGSGFQSGCTVTWDGTALATTFSGPTSVSATLPSGAIGAPGSKTVRVTNPSAPSTPSNAFVVTVYSAAPTIAALSPSTITTGSGTTVVALSGVNFHTTIRAYLDGVEVPSTVNGSTSANVLLDAATLVTPGVRTLVVDNVYPALVASSNGLPLNIAAPSVTTMTPSTVPVGSPGVTIDLVCTNVATHSTIYADGVALPTTLIGASTLRTVIPVTFGALAREGGIAINVQNTPIAVSPTRALRIGSSANAGVVTHYPLTEPIPPNSPFTVALEGGTPGAPVTLVVDVTSPAPVTLFPNATANMVVALSTIGSSVVFDGIGMLGAPTPGFNLAPNPSTTPPPAGTPLPGSLTLPTMVTGPTPAGINLTLQAFYLDPSSPIGIRLTWPRYPIAF